MDDSLKLLTLGAVLGGTALLAWQFRPKDGFGAAKSSSGILPHERAATKPSHASSHSAGLHGAEQLALSPDYQQGYAAGKSWAEGFQHGVGASMGRTPDHTPSSVQPAAQTGARFTPMPGRAVPPSPHFR